MRRYPTLLFDLDGTLIDSLGLIVRCYRFTLEQHRMAVPPDEYWLAGVGRPLREQLRPFAADEAALDALVACYRVHNDEHHDAMVSAYDGVADALAALHARGAAIGVVTSKQRDRAERGLAVTGLAPFVSVVIGSDDVVRHKPDPEPVHAALARLGAPADGAVMIGDSIHDLAAGRSAGTACAAVLWGAGRADEMRACQPEHCFETPAELATLV